MAQAVARIEGNALGRVTRTIAWIEAAVAIIEDLALYVLVSAVFILTALQVSARYVFDSPFVWTEELVRYLFVWIVMVGAGAAIRTDGHLALTMVADRLSGGFRHLLSLIGAAAITVFAMVLVTQGTDMTLGGFYETSSSLPVRMYWFYSALPVGGALMIWHLLAKAAAYGQAVAEQQPVNS